MLDRILYRLASPLAREIIDSLRTDRDRWMQYTVHGVPELRNYDASLTVTFCGNRTRRMGFPINTVSVATRLALRRAVNKWRNDHG